MILGQFVNLYGVGNHAKIPELSECCMILSFDHLYVGVVVTVREWLKSGVHFMANYSGSM